MDTINDVKNFLEIVNQLILETLQIESIGIPITLNTDLVSGVGRDTIDLSSIDYVDFIIKIEKEFDIIFDFNTKIYTVGDLYDYIMSFSEGK